MNTNALENANFNFVGAPPVAETTPAAGQSGARDISAAGEKNVCGVVNRTESKSRPQDSFEETSNIEAVAPQAIRTSNIEGYGENMAPSFVVSQVIERKTARGVETTMVSFAQIPETPEQARLKEQKRRAQLVKDFRTMTLSVAQGGQGLSKVAAARLLGESVTTLWRYRKMFNEGGEEALLPRTANSGRPSDFDILLKDQAFCDKLLDLYLSTAGSSGGNMLSRFHRTGRRTAKMATALTVFAEEPECPPALAAKLRKGKFPICFLRFLKGVTPELESRFRGQKHFKLNGLVSRRDLTLRFPNGDRAEMPAGFKWVFDDMSVNQPFWCEVDGQILFSRQGLYAIDQRSLKWLGRKLIARPREAYRAEDILRFLRWLFQAHGGKPDVIVFEQGVWKARKIHGFRLSEVGAPVDEEWLRPEMADAEKHLLTDGLQAIGIKVIFATSAHGKVIESCFNPLQDQIALRTRDFVNIGRHAGEFEIPAKRLAKMRRQTDVPGMPSFLGFAQMNVLAERIDAAIEFMNRKINSRGEVPDEIWAHDLEKRPLAENTGADAAVFLPEVRLRQIEGGKVTVTVNGQEHDFRSEDMIRFGGGYRVYLRFDPAEPARGAAVYNRETLGSAANIGAMADGQFMFFAAWEMPAPQVDVSGPVRGVEARPVSEFYGDDAIDQGDTIRRKQGKLVAVDFKAFPRPGQPAVRVKELRDGEGRLARAESVQGPTSNVQSQNTAVPSLNRDAAIQEVKQRNDERDKLRREALDAIVNMD